MTQEEKARAYDEALKVAVAAYKDEDRHLKGTLERIFPELKDSEDETIRKEIITHCRNTRCVTEEGAERIAKWITWLERQGMERKQLYVRFGDIPSNEKSKIYRGEEEIGDENGVSVYPAFELNGNIVLGLTLPITKTTLYTQQHLLEYDNRPCYLVSGDYVGKGTDGEPLIRNISIIKRLDNYRIKELEKQGEQKPYSQREECLDCQFNYAGECKGFCVMKRNEQKPKFKVGDWIINNDVYGDVPVKIKEIGNYLYLCERQDGVIIELNKDVVLKEFKHWDITDAKDGDVLAEKNAILIFKGIGNTEWDDVIDYHCYYDCCQKNFILQDDVDYWGDIKNNQLKPATNEQCDLLFGKMKEAGYEWDWRNKELKKVTKFKIGDKIINKKGEIYEVIDTNAYWYTIKDHDNNEWYLSFDAENKYQLLNKS